MAGSCLTRGRPSPEVCLIPITAISQRLSDIDEPCSIEFGCKLFELAADVIGGKLAVSHTRVSAPAVMKIPLVRNDGGDS